MSRRYQAAFLLTILVTALDCSRVLANDDLSPDLTRESKGHILVLRNFNTGDSLTYGDDGRLLRGGRPGTWTLDGHIRVKDIALRQDTLEVEGVRVLPAFDLTKQRMYGLIGQPVRLEIGMHQQEATLDKLRALIFKVFHPESEDTEALMPSYWKPVFEGRKLDQITPEDLGALDGDRVYTVGKSDIAAPVPVFTPDPPYSQQARVERLQGRVKFLVVLDKTGRIRDLLEVSPALGQGLDEIAIDTVQRWKLRAATKGGVPVSVWFWLEITFRLA